MQEEKCPICNSTGHTWHTAGAVSVVSKCEACHHLPTDLNALQREVHAKMELLTK